MFGRSKTPAQQVKEYGRTIKKSVRELDRERMQLERNEKKLMAEIKKEAKDGHMDAAKIKAKDLVRTRSYIKKMYKMKSHMETISLRLMTMSSSMQMAQCMKGVTRTMGKMNAKMNLPQVSKIMMEFDKQNEMMGMKEEMMGDAMDDAFAEDEDEEQEEEVLGAVLAELGVGVSNQISDTPTDMMPASTSGDTEVAGIPAAGGGGEATGDDLDAELQKRLDNLRRT